MKVRLFGFSLLTFALLLTICFQSTERANSQTGKSNLTPAELELITEINLARAQPAVYAGYLEELKPRFNGKKYRSGNLIVATQEGWSAVEDAINFMRAAKPLPALTVSQGLTLCAKSHVTDQSASGSTGHRGGNRTMIEDRVKPYGSWTGGIGENLAYGNESARERLLTWLIDDGFASRGHRKRLMSDGYAVAGISCGPHPEYKTMCVVTFAGGFTELNAAKPSDSPTAKPISNNQTTQSNATNKAGGPTTPKPQKY